MKPPMDRQGSELRESVKRLCREGVSEARREKSKKRENERAENQNERERTRAKTYLDSDLKQQIPTKQSQQRHQCDVGS